jgi:hypothetical protein
MRSLKNGMRLPDLESFLKASGRSSRPLYDDTLPWYTPLPSS